MSDRFMEGADEGTALTTFRQELSDLDVVLHLSRRAWWGAQAGKRLSEARNVLSWSKGLGDFYMAMRHHCLPRSLYVQEDALVWEAFDQNVRAALGYQVLSLEAIRDGRLAESGEAYVLEDIGLKEAFGLMNQTLEKYDFGYTPHIIGHAGNGVVTECRDMEETRLVFGRAAEDGYEKNPAYYLKRGQKKRLAEVFRSYDSYWRALSVVKSKGSFMPSTEIPLCHQ